MTGKVASAGTDIDAPRSEVWRVLTDPDEIEKYMFGSRVETDWKPGSPITWKGEYEGKTYEDTGEILEVEPERRLKLTHSSAASSGGPASGSFHTLVYSLEDKNGMTHVSVSQDNNTSDEAAEHSQANWERMLSGLKEVVEARSRRA